MEFTQEAILKRLKAALKNSDSRIEGSFSMDNLQALSEELARMSMMEVKPLWDEIEKKIEDTITSGNERHYEYWAKQVKDISGCPLIGNARAKGIRDGTGLVSVSCITPEGKAPGEEVLSAVKAYIDLERPVGAKPEVTAGELLEVTITGTIELMDGAELLTVKEQAEAKLGAYISALAFLRGKTVLNYYRVSTILSETAGIKEVLDYTVNEGKNSITASFSQFFTLKGLVLHASDG